MTAQHWVILTGEYPPDPGGVSDYTQAVARGLAAAGDRVCVFAPACPAGDPGDPGVQVQRLPDCFGPRSLKVLDQQLAALERPYRLLVQYVPHGYGYKAMNVLFAWWLFRRRRREPLEIMFHEVQFPFRWRQPLKHNILAAVHRLMTALVTRCARRIYITIPAWEPMIKPFVRAGCPVIWMPAFSNLSLNTTLAEAAQARARCAGNKAVVLLGHFGTFGVGITALLRPIMIDLLAAGADRLILLMGRGSTEFLAGFIAEHPELKGRLHATGALPAEQVAAHLAACDVLVQPYPDGISCRRTSLLASLALGLPIVTNAGVATEPLWSQEQAVELCPAPDPAAIVAHVEAVLADAGRRTQLAANAKRAYDAYFRVEKTIEKLRSSG